MITSRGCVYQCSFCDRSVFQRGFRFNSAEYTYAHMEYLRRNFGIRHVNIYDDLFTANRKRIMALCEKLAREIPKFESHRDRARPRREDYWEDRTGYIDNVMNDMYLKDHPSPEDIAYYVCGPPVMMDSVIRMLEELGDESENIAYDDFGE